jgi:ectoine hydroxylase-related dioxygenase (phytanoyl-CoA dioxygenase family)
MNGSEYHFHHLHAACHKSGMPSLGWHHDYEQYKERGREFTMIHIFLYLNGLNGEIGDLLLIPGSHNQNLKRYEYSSKDFAYFKNYKRINNIAEGSIIIINSALIHARQAKSGGDLKPRYFIDLSFCQSGIKWPPYRESKNWKNILPILKEKYANNNLSEFIFDHSAFELSLRDKIIEKFKLNNFKNLIAKFIGKNGKIIN